MNLSQALILGVIQGLTEFLPISSSGHLVIVPELFNWKTQPLVFDTVLHLGTACALVFYFYKDILEIFRKRKYILLLLVGSLPAAFTGFFLDTFFETYFRSATSAASFLVLGSLIMLFAERQYKRIWHNERISEVSGLDNKKSFIVGVFQTLALFPGISRSGSTISGGMFLGLTRELAARFSFLLSIPIVIGAGTFKLVDSYQELTLDLGLAVGFFSSFIVGMLAIKFLLNFLKRNNLYPFIVYRLILALFIFLMFV